MRTAWMAAGVALFGFGLGACDDEAGTTADTTTADTSAEVTTSDTSGSEATAASETTPVDTIVADTAADTATTETAAETTTDTATTDTATTETTTTDTATDADTTTPPPRVQVVLFTHIEDQTPSGTLGSAQSKASYTKIRDALLDVGRRAAQDHVQWVLQPDWKILEAARQYEDEAMMASTGGKNFLVYLHDDLGVAIDPHSHENGGYNYTDVAHLLELLGVGGSTVIGGHIWDPALPQFQHWERFRTSQPGEKYPDASWRGDVLIGSGTPNHVNDPVVSGIWRPKSPSEYFTDDPDGNIVAIGAWHDDVDGVKALVALYADGTVAPDQMLTASWNINPSEITAANGPANVEQAIFLPLKELEDNGKITLTDFTTLVAHWRARGAEASIYQP